MRLLTMLQNCSDLDVCVFPFLFQSIRYAYLYATLCFFGGIAITALFDQLLHAFQHWLTHHRRKKANRQNDLDAANSSSEDDTSTEPCNRHDVERPRLPHEPIEINVDTSSVGEPAEIDEHAGHGGHLIASLYTQNAQEEGQGHDLAALIRMGIFAGIALAFHVSRFSLSTLFSFSQHRKSCSNASDLLRFIIPISNCVVFFFFVGGKGGEGVRSYLTFLFFLMVLMWVLMSYPIISRIFLKVWQHSYQFWKMLL